MSNLINDMKVMAKDAHSVKMNDSANANANENFKKILGKQINNIEAINNSALSLQDKFMLGDPNVSLPEVMTTMQKADIYTNILVESRNKILSAYHEIMNMSI